MIQKNASPVRLELLIVIVDRKRREYYLDLLQSLDINMQVSIKGYGTANDEILKYLGLSGIEKTVIFAVVRADRLDAVQEVLEDKFKTIRGGKGVAASVPLDEIISLKAFGFLSNEIMTVKEGS